MEDSIAIIPARGGSKGIPRKNIVDLNGYPLISWSIKFAQRTKSFSRCIVTTDDKEIADISRIYGAEVPFIRDQKLATDTSKSSDVILDVIEKCKLTNSSNIILLEPTSPYRTLQDYEKVKKAIKTSIKGKVVSVTKAKSSHYVFQYQMNKKFRMTKIDKNSEANNTRRQEVENAYFLNGAFYGTNIATYKEDPNFCCKETIGVETSYLSELEIDTEEDLEVARAIFSYKEMRQE